jgi:membrane associated rhomboid family serine protease
LLPLADHNPRRTTPVVNILLIVVNVLMFLWEVSLGPRLEPALFSVAFVPARFWGLPGALLPNVITMFVSMFLHGGWLHLGGNMLYLWIFGDNLNKVMGHVRYFLFYMVCGLAAGLAHIAFNSGSNVPSIGASGAISGVLGGYMLLFPRNRVRVMTRGGIMAVPAYVMLGLWILIQIVSGAMNQGGEGGGVAFMAHVGGFAAGLVLVKLFAAGRTRASYA